MTVIVSYNIMYFIVLSYVVCTYLQDELFSLVATGCKILLYLNISFTNITDASLRVISQ